MDNEKRPTTRAVAVRKSNGSTYKLYKNGQLWKSGDASLPEGFMCGYVMNPDAIETAIDNFEEEMRCMLAAYL